jgi:competence ComEA-like helix-hairpin-helix protein
MALDDRDYMRERLKQRPADPWWKRIKPMPAIAIATALLALGSTAIWFLRDARTLLPRAGSAEGTLRVNINTATRAELESIPGIGNALAALIVSGRPYKSVDELERVRGIGPQSLESLRPFVKVEGEAEKLR